MEDTLRVVKENKDNFVCLDVLILVLMEDTLRVNVIKSVLKIEDGLNPCFNGRYSQRDVTTCYKRLRCRS